MPMAVASLVLGIVSLFFGLFGIGFRFLGIIFAVIGIVLSCKNKDSENAHIAKAGKICSIIGLVLCIIILLAGIVFAGWLNAYIGSSLFSELTDLLRHLRALLVS